MNTLRIAGFPGRYVQGAGALDAFGHELRELGAGHALFITDDAVEALLGERLRAALAAGGMATSRLRFPGECSREGIDELVAAIDLTVIDRANGARRLAVVGLGGGKTIDTAKGVAKALDAILVIAPTIASNDSPTSRLIVLYDAHHRLQGVDLLARNPDLVLVDTAEIARAPVRFFRAGIGDALSKKFEAAACFEAGGRNFHGGAPPLTAGLLAERCYELIAAHGEQAVLAVIARRCDASVEAVVEASVLLSGLGFESGGLSIAHALVRGVSAVPAIAGALHGEAVAFGTVVQILLERRPRAELDRHLDLLARTGLNVSLAALGKAELSAAEMDDLVAATLQAPYIGHFRGPVDAAALQAAVIEADRLLAGRVVRATS